MKNKINKIIALLLVMVFAVTLAGCSLGGGAKKGYKIRQEETSNFYAALPGATGEEVTYLSCNYVSIVREGSKTVYFYEASYVANIGSSSLPGTEYFAWIEGEESTEDSSKIAYQLAYSQVNKGEANGKIGSL